MDDAYPPIPAGRAALNCRCPRCGEGRLYHGLLTVVARCGVCGLDLSAHDAADGPAVFAIFVLGFVVAPLAVLVDIWLAPPVWVHLLLWTPVVIGGAIVLLRPMKAFFVGQHYRRVLDDHDC